MNANKLRWNHLLTKSSIWLISSNFLVAFGSIWLLIECPSALSSKFKDLVDNHDPWILLVSSVISLCYSLYKAFPRVAYTKKFKSTQTSISLKVGDLLDEKENIVIGSSNYFDFDYSKTTGASLKSQLISRLFNNDIETIDNLLKKVLLVPKIWL